MATGQERIDSIAIRVLTELEDFEKAARLQEVIWGFSEFDSVPPRLFIVNEHVGGLALGASDAGRMIGFSFAMAGRRKSGETFLHSNMTGLLPEYQGRGLGRRMKLLQREEAMAYGYEMVEWTFDPLEIRNAYFNVEKLGAVMRSFRPNCYGITSSKLHGSIPTDRLVAEWELDTDRARYAIGHGRSPQGRFPVRSRYPRTLRARGRRTQSERSRSRAKCGSSSRRRSPTDST